MRWLIVICLMGCGGTESPPPRVEPDPEPVATEPVEIQPPASGPGEGCDAPPFQQGSCADGLVCAPGPGGYCTAPCFGGSDCPEGTVCTDTVRAGRWCLATCPEDGCREGYTCEESWNTCFMAGWHAPRLAECEGDLAERGQHGEPRLASHGEGAGTYSMEPAAALGPNGSVAVAFMAMGTQFEPSRIATSLIASDGTVSESRPIEAGKMQSFDPWMARAPDGKLHLVWLAHDGRGDQNAIIAYSTSTDGVAWSEPRAIHDADVDCPENRPGCLDKPMIAIAPRGAAHAGRLYVTYYGLGDGGSMRAIHSDDGETWSDSVTVGSGAYGDLEIDSRGHVHVVFSNGPDGANRFGDPRNFVEYRTSTDGGDTFSEPVHVSDAEHSVPFYFSNATIAIDPRRRWRYVAYPAGAPNGEWKLYLAVSRNGTDWTRTEVAGQTCANRMTPTLAVDSRGTVHLMWAEGGSNRAGMLHTTCRAGATRCTEPTRINDAPFAGYTMVRHDASWRGEYDAMVVDGRTIHAVWTQVIDEGGVATSRVFHAQL